MAALGGTVIILVSLQCFWIFRGGELKFFEVYGTYENGFTYATLPIAWKEHMLYCLSAEFVKQLSNRSFGAWKKVLSFFKLNLRIY